MTEVKLRWVKYCCYAVALRNLIAMWLILMQAFLSRFFGGSKRENPPIGRVFVENLSFFNLLKFFTGFGEICREYSQIWAIN